jgi:hypothetical protein
VLLEEFVNGGKIPRGGGGLDDLFQCTLQENRIVLVQPEPVHLPAHNGKTFPVFRAAINADFSAAFGVSRRAAMNFVMG